MTPTVPHGNIWAMKIHVGDFTNKVCPRCGEERLKTSLFDPSNENSEVILYCQNCHYQEWL